MVKKQDLVILVVGIAAVLTGYFYIDDQDSIFNKLIEPVEPVNWSEVSPREIVKNSILITLLEKNGNDCKIEAKKLDVLLSPDYFTRSQEVASELKYDVDSSTIQISCERLPANESTLHIWYVTPESNKHAEKYQIFITEREQEPNVE